jgi:hypothetical protein
MGTKTAVTSPSIMMKEEKSKSVLDKDERGAPEVVEA